MKSTGIIIISIIVLFALMIVPAAADLTCVPNCPYIIAKGDTFTINWTGMNNGTATVMVIGRNHFHTLTAVPDAHGVFSVTLIPEVTRNFSSGQYALVVQDPGANGKFEIGTRLSETGHILVTDHDLIVADLGLEKDLKGSVHSEVETLSAALRRAGVDDTLTPSYFLVEEPVVQFTQSRDRATDYLIFEPGNSSRLYFHGTTNLGTQNPLRARVYESVSRRLVADEPLPPIRNGAINSWEYDMDSSRFPTGEYLITVGWQNDNTTGTGTALFFIGTPSGTTVSPSPVPAAGEESPVHETVQPEKPVPTHASPVAAIPLALGCFGLVIVIRKRSRMA